MDWMKVVFAGGWIPEGERTQMLGLAAILGTLVMSVVHWGAGDMDLASLVKVFSDNWEGLFAGLMAVFLGDKIDAKSS